MRTAINNISNFMKMCQDTYNITSNNLANNSTCGFKKQLAVERQRAMLSYVDDSNGPVKETGNPLDMTIHGDGFFVVKTDRGSRYTRAGNFTLNEKRQLVNERGETVSDDMGRPIEIKGRPTITDEGIIFSDNERVAKLAIVKPDNPWSVTTEGSNNLNFQPAFSEKDEYMIKSGYLEEANVNLIDEMVRVTETLREFEFAQRILKMEQDLSEKCASSVGKSSV